MRAYSLIQLINKVLKNGTFSTFGTYMTEQSLSQCPYKIKVVAYGCTHAGLPEQARG